MGFIAPENIEFRDGQPKSTTTSGIPYVTFVTRAVVPEGGPYPLGEETEEAAWAAFNANFAQYMHETNAKTVEWRVQPSPDQYDLGEGPRYSIRARFAVTEINHGA